MRGAQRAELPTRPLLAGHLVTLVVVALAAALLGSWGASAGAASSSTTPPFVDAASQGYLGLCNAAGQQITSGSIYTVPFAWRAVSSVAAVPPYNNRWRTAILMAYQPQEGLFAEEWSGQALTDSARYSNPSHPMAAATYADDSLEDFLESYAAVWDGWIQLRMYLGTQDAEAYSSRYPTLDIHVVGDTWHAVGGGTVDCHSGTSESIETILLPPSRLRPPATSSTTSTTSVASTGRSPSRGGTSTGGGSRSGDPVGATARPASAPWMPLGAALIGVVVVGLGAALWRRQRLTPVAVRVEPAKVPREGDQS